MSKRALSEQGHIIRELVLWSALAWLLAAGAVEAARYGTAFPGAEGYGSKSKGGRGGRVLIVDSLEDGSRESPREGTLRWALEQSGKRIVVFRVAGTIELRSKLLIREPFITVAGQTAPGEGITIKDFPLVVQTHDVIVQGIRSRLGPVANTDAFDVEGPGAKNVVIDHCSFSWSTDEVVTTHSGTRKVTFQNSIFSEALNCSVHPKGCHSAGMLVRDGSRKLTLRRNFFAHNSYRNPRLFGDSAALRGKTASFDFYNNVVYDWGSWALAGDGVARINIESNFFKLGPSSRGYPGSLEVRSRVQEAGHQLWLSGNVGPSCPSGCVDDWQQMVKAVPARSHAAKRISTPSSDALPAIEGRDLVMAVVGASYRLDETGLRVYRRDAVDSRLATEFWTGTGGLIDDPAEVGGWPRLDPGTPVVDTDLDGMPDAWEELHGLDPSSPADAQGNPDLDRYSNIEEYIFEIDPNSAD